MNLIELLDKESYDEEIDPDPVSSFLLTKLIKYDSVNLYLNIILFHSSDCKLNFWRENKFYGGYEVSYKKLNEVFMSLIKLKEHSLTISKLHILIANVERF